MNTIGIGLPSRRPSLRRIVEVDYFAMLAFLVPVVFWAILLLVMLFGVLPDLRGREPLVRSDLPNLVKVAIVATMASLAVLFWRIRTFRTMYARGTEVAGRITKVSIFRDRGRIEYSYTYAGRDHTGGNMVHKTDRTESLRAGMDAVLLVDPTKPGRALIRDLYT